MQLKGFARSFFLPITHALSAISRNSTKIFKSHIRRSPQSTPLQNHCHAASRHNCVVVGNIHELMEHILRYTDSDTLLVCTAVNRMVGAIAKEYYWSTALNRGIRPILKSFEVWYEDDHVDAEYKRRREWFSKPPSPTHWQPFLTSVGQHIRELTLDFGTRPVTHWFLERLLESCPPSVKLPKLTALRVVVSESALELELSARFFQAKITDLIVDIREPLPKRGRALQVMQRDASPDIPTFSDYPVSVPQRATSLRPFFDQVSSKMPFLDRLSLNVHDGEWMARSWIWFATMVNSLQYLRILELPPYALAPGLLATVHSHATLQRVLAPDIVTSSTPEPYLGQPYVDHHVRWHGGHIPGTLTHLTMMIHPSELVTFLHNTHGLERIIHFHILFSEYIPDDASLASYFIAIAEACSNLEDLHIMPLMHSNDAVLRLSYRDLQPLTRCSSLKTLCLQTQYTTYLTNEEFEHLIVHWPQLELLELDSANAICPDPEEEAPLSLGHAICALSKYCPNMQGSTLYVSPVIDNSAFNSIGISRLKSLTLSLGLPGSLKPSHLLVTRFLRQTPPPMCVIKWSAGNKTVFDVVDADRVKWEMRKENICGFVKIVDELRGFKTNAQVENTPP